MSLLPFLDIIFGTIGVFVVTFAFQNLVEMNEGIPLGVDSVVTCVDGRLLETHWPDGSLGPAGAPERSEELLHALAGESRPFRSLLAAFGAQCVKGRRQFLRGFERYVDAAQGSAATDASRPSGLMLELFPIGDAADAQALLSRWRGGTR